MEEIRHTHIQLPQFVAVHPKTLKSGCDLEKSEDYLEQGG